MAVELTTWTPSRNIALKSSNDNQDEKLSILFNSRSQVLLNRICSHPFPVELQPLEGLTGQSQSGLVRSFGSASHEHNETRFGTDQQPCQKRSKLNVKFIPPSELHSAIVAWDVPLANLFLQPASKPSPSRFAFVLHNQLFQHNSNDKQADASMDILKAKTMLCKIIKQFHDVAVPAFGITMISQNTMMRNNLAIWRVAITYSTILNLLQGLDVTLCAQRNSLCIDVEQIPGIKWNSREQVYMHWHSFSRDTTTKHQPRRSLFKLKHRYLMIKYFELNFPESYTITRLELKDKYLKELFSKKQVSETNLVGSLTNLVKTIYQCLILADLTGEQRERSLSMWQEEATDNMGNLCCVWVSQFSQ